ncbi:hypothetical protein NPIL_540241 [Nephila pilipes]|uniref:Uncharacterized protein n=1 Tax=Nephila pilipes TaxID=299642 RepID=A0A8X6N3C6_NEPPI|nr:hypothetical protein NPIL_540241 [Nephila pilipes]
MSPIHVSLRSHPITENKVTIWITPFLEVPGPKRSQNQFGSETESYGSSDPLGPWGVISLRSFGIGVHSSRQSTLDKFPAKKWTLSKKPSVNGPVSKYLFSRR